MLLKLRSRNNTRNKFERKLDEQLSKSKVKYSYETEKIPYVIYGLYNPDFVLVLPSGHIIYIEAKGHFRPEAKRKMAAVKKQNPSLDIRFIFYSKNKTYIKFAEKHGFPWAIGEIPEGWYHDQR